MMCLHEVGSASLQSLDDFMSALCKRFEDPFATIKAKAAIKQGPQTVSECALEFKGLVERLRNWHEELKVQYFQKGLRLELLEQALAGGNPETLDKWIILAGTVEADWLSVRGKRVPKGRELSDKPEKKGTAVAGSEEGPLLWDSESSEEDVNQKVTRACCNYEDRSSRSLSAVLTLNIAERVVVQQGLPDCPQLLRANKILVPVDVIKPITLKAKNLPQPQSGQRGYECIITIQGIEKRVPALRFNSSSVQCQNTSYSYDGMEINSLPVDLTVVWNGNFNIDNPAQNKVHLYKCGAMRDSCGLCLKADLDYECGWCEDLNQCTLKHHCPILENRWLELLGTGGKCTNPKITEISPVRGPREGGTRVTIRGENLGLEFRDIASHVKVAGVECVPLVDGYIPAEQIVCEMGEAKLSQHAGNVDICVAECKPEFMAKSSQFYYFTMLSLSDLSPKQGPVSGGTQVTITGKNLNAGSNVSVMFGEYPCLFHRRTAEYIICNTTAFGNVLEKNMVDVSVKVDKATLHKELEKAKMHKELKFKYVEDPTILRIEPEWSIVSGNTPVTVWGTNLDLIQNPQIRAKYGGKEHIN
ncbi:plexin-A4-like, partial [Python bivittatus]|uniref:Plexin-A4-like n=1 Tax=Python bivittatus TaxID=176946 RepID=A0A9F5J235_PYTBI